MGDGSEEDGERAIGREKTAAQSSTRGRSPRGMFPARARVWAGLWASRGSAGEDLRAAAHAPGAPREGGIELGGGRAWGRVEGAFCRMGVGWSDGWAARGGRLDPSE